MSEKFLLVGSQPDSAWTSVLRAALLPSPVHLDVIAPPQAQTQSEREHYALVVIDAAGLDTITSLISTLHRQKPMVPIVVATDSPTWQHAREAFLSGATDYIHKSLDAEALRTTLAEIKRKSSAG
jgi:DNA-binding NtrC family response regulator